MFCQKCGFEIKDGNMICPQCGCPTTEMQRKNSNALTVKIFSIIADSLGILSALLAFFYAIKQGSGFNYLLIVGFALLAVFVRKLIIDILKSDKEGE